MAKLYRKRGILYAWGILPSGERWAKSTRQTEQRAAGRVARLLERDALAAADTAAKASSTLNAAFVALFASLTTKKRKASTLRTMKQKAGHGLRLLGPMRDIATLEAPHGSEALRVYVEQRSAEGAKLSTIFSEVSTVKQALRCAARAGTYHGDTRALEVAELEGACKPRRNRLTAEQARRLTAEVPPQWREHVEAYLQTGVRRMELYVLTADDLDLAWNRVHVRGTKTELADRWLPMTARVRRILVARARAAPTGPLFREWKRALPDLAEACDRASVPRCTVTDLRRTFGSMLLDAGVSASVLKELFGHATTKQIDLTYGVAGDAAKQAAVRLHPAAGSRAVARTEQPVRQKTRKAKAPIAETPGNATRRSTSGNHAMQAFAAFLTGPGVAVAGR